MTYPVAALTANSTTLSGKSYGNGTYIVTATRELASRPKWLAFDNSLTTAWQSTDNAGLSTVNYWIQIEVPVEICLTSFWIQTGMNTTWDRSPSNFTISGSRLGSSTFETLGTFNKSAKNVRNLDTYTIASPANTIYYNRFKLNNNTNIVLLSLLEWRLTGALKPVI